MNTPLDQPKTPTDRCIFCGSPDDTVASEPAPQAFTCGTERTRYIMTAWIRSDECRRREADQLPLFKL